MTDSGSPYNYSAIGMGALVILAVVLPTVFLVRIIASGDEPSSVELLVPLALLLGFPAGGFQAARRAARFPFVHSALAGLAAWAVAIPITALRADVTLAQVLTLTVFVLITEALAMGGGLIAARQLAAIRAAKTRP